MQKGRHRQLDFEVDKLTNSIENTFTGENLETEIVRLTTGDATILRNLKWQFDWHKEFQEPDSWNIRSHSKERSLCVARFSKYVR